ETRIAELTDTLNKRLGSLKELFGVLQQVASDTQGNFDNSVISAQPEFSNRGEFLAALAAKMGKSSELAEIEEIERLRTYMLNEMVESGKVVRFQGQVFSANGQESTREVIRIGSYNLVSEGEYVNYEPATGNMSVFPRQPQQGRYTQSAADITSATSGLVTFGLDPLRGQLLSLEVDKPDLKERVMQGKTVGYVIIGVGIFGLLLALWRLAALSLASQKVSSQLKNSTPNANNALGRVLLVADEHKNADTETLELKLSEAIFKETPALSRGLMMLKIISVVAPLLGLLGTVTGMIVTFQAITLFGTGDPKLMAGGISTALVTTVLGLVVAIPMVLLHTLVSGFSKNILHVLQEQSAGIIAERSESSSGQA
ncbi:MAG: MotA/TolQ/ExbB proton channel family protein, partial [Pseudomonadota bacterium]